MVGFLGMHARYLVIQFPVNVPLPTKLAFHVGPERPLLAALLLVLDLGLTMGLLVLPRPLADLRKAARVPSATDLRRLKLAPPLLLRVLLPYLWILLSYLVHLQWSKSKCLAL